MLTSNKYEQDLENIMKKISISSQYGSFQTKKVYAPFMFIRPSLHAATIITSFEVYSPFSVDSSDQAELPEVTLQITDLIMKT